MTKRETDDGSGAGGESKANEENGAGDESKVDAENGTNGPNDGNEPDHTIVAATMADLDALVDLWLALASDQREEGSHLRARPNAQVVRDRLAEGIVSEEVFLARIRPTKGAPPGNASPGDDPVGFVLVSRERGSYERDAERGFVDALFVHPGSRGRGIGSSLLDRGERRLAAAGAGAVAIEAMASNVDARRLYRRHGYELHRVELEKELPDR